MSRTAIALIALVSALLAAGGGWWLGLSQGQAKAQAKQDAQLVQELSGLITSHQNLVTTSNLASQRLRQATGKRQSADRKTTQELIDVLAQTADNRVNCVLPVDGVRSLQTAHDRAARAAASGLVAGLPATGASASGR